eukprot:1361535-Amorphochlora_amoeboformis.AAC.1
MVDKGHPYLSWLCLAALASLSLHLTLMQSRSPLLNLAATAADRKGMARSALGFAAGERPSVGRAGSSSLGLRRSLIRGIAGVVGSMGAGAAFAATSNAIDMTANPRTYLLQ